MYPEKIAARQKEILIVDDDRFIAEILSVSLESNAEFRVIAFSTAAAAGEYLKTRRPDIMIIDQGLPDMEGIEMIRAWKTDPGNGSIPVIVLSGSDDPRLKRDSFEAGASAYLLKPFNPIRLREIIREMTA